MLYLISDNLIKSGISNQLNNYFSLNFCMYFENSEALYSLESLTFKISNLLIVNS